MLLVLAVAAGLWGAGHYFGASVQARWLVLGLLFTLILALQVALPEAHPVRQATGGSPAPWLLLAGAGALVWAYRVGLSWLRARAHTPAEPPKRATLTAPELERYARHIVLREIGGPGQARLHKARVLVIGAGGLGAPALLYLGGAGVGMIGVIDDDRVAASNLQRQVIHGEGTLGMPKVFSAQARLKDLNPFVTVRPYNRRLSEEIAAELFAEYDVILDGSDNFATRYLANRTAVAQGLPLVSGALSQWEGQLAVFDPARGGPCYRCLFPEPPAPELAPSCAEAGVAGPLPGVVGAMMAMEAVKLVTGVGQPLTGQMLIYDALWAETRTIRTKRRPDCPDCGTPH